MDRSAHDTIYYDGDCGLCHGFVRFVLARDPAARFRFAALDSEAFRAAVPEPQRATLPDSVVVLPLGGALLTQSDAALFVLAGLPQPWPAIAAVARIVPRALRDVVYRGVARVRRRLFAAPSDACPVVPPELRDRFL